MFRIVLKNFFFQLVSKKRIEHGAHAEDKNTKRCLIITLSGVLLVPNSQ